MPADLWAYFLGIKNDLGMGIQGNILCPYKNTLLHPLDKTPEFPKILGNSREKSWQMKILISRIRSDNICIFLFLKQEVRTHLYSMWSGADLPFIKLPESNEVIEENTTELQPASPETGNTFFTPKSY